MVLMHVYAGFLILFIFYNEWKPTSHNVTCLTVQTDKDEVMRMTERTVKALQSYASTGDIRQLLLVQRYLTSVPDQNGDM